VAALTSFGGDVIAGGSFTQAGGAEAINVARWDGSSWSAMPLIGSHGSWVSALATYDGSLVAGGAFVRYPEYEFVARWIGSSWPLVGGGRGNAVNALSLFGSDLVAGGVFDTRSSAVGRWNGSTWVPLGSGPGADFSPGVNAGRTHCRRRVHGSRRSPRKLHHREVGGSRSKMVEAAGIEPMRT
jgi:hypothetical protein